MSGTSLYSPSISDAFDNGITRTASGAHCGAHNQLIYLGVSKPTSRNFMPPPPWKLARDMYYKGVGHLPHLARRSLSTLMSLLVAYQ